MTSKHKNLISVHIINKLGAIPAIPKSSKSAIPPVPSAIPPIGGGSAISTPPPPGGAPPIPPPPPPPGFNFKSLRKDLPKDDG